MHAAGQSTALHGGWMVLGNREFETLIPCFSPVVNAVVPGKLPEAHWKPSLPLHGQDRPTRDARRRKKKAQNVIMSHSGELV